MRSIFCTAIVVILCLPLVAFSEREGEKSSSTRPDLMGDIPLEDTTPKKQDVEGQAFKEVEAWGQSLQAAVSAQKGAEAPKALGEGGISYLNSLYLLCTAKRGPCGFILDSMLEADLLTSKQAGSARCPTMNRFWKGWLANEGDRRLQFQVPIARAAELIKFNNSERPRFIKCKETLEAIMADSNAFSGRYGSASAATKSVGALNALVQEVSKSNIDVFAASGMARPGAAE